MEFINFIILSMPQPRSKTCTQQIKTKQVLMFYHSLWRFYQLALLTVIANEFLKFTIVYKLTSNFASQLEQSLNP